MKLERNSPEREQESQSLQEVRQFHLTFQFLFSPFWQRFRQNTTHILIIT